MSTKYFCAHCDAQFIPEEEGTKPRCPKCMRRSGVERLQGASPKKSSRGRWLWAAAALALIAAAVGYGTYRSGVITLEETPPLRPLNARELSAYLARDQVRVGAYETLFTLPDRIEGWPANSPDLVKQMRGRSSSWSLEQTLPRPVMTADQTMAAMGGEDERVRLYPLESATALTSMLRARGVRAMVAEVWQVEGDPAPADPSGTLGYFVTAVYEDGSAEPSAYLDPWGGREGLSPSSTRVLRDTEVVAAALGTEATRIAARSGDTAAALPMIEAALLLDPLSPSLRVVHAGVLMESGGMAQASQELEAAVQLRPDGPHQLNLVQLRLFQAGMLEANGQQEAAEAQLAEGNRLVAEVLGRWPRYGRAHLTLATIYLGLDDPERAEIELHAASAFSPDAPMLGLVWAQYHLARDELFAAATQIKHAVSLDPDNWQLRLQAAQILHAVGEEDAARQNAEAAIQLVVPDKRAEVRAYLKRVVGTEPVGDMADRLPAPPSEDAAGKADLAEPALMLGDPSNLRLRDPGEELKLDLDE